MKKGISMYQKLKTWCAKNGVDYRTAYLYMHRHKISQAEAIRYYSTPRVTLLQLCIDAELPYPCVCNYKRRHGLSNEDAVKHYAESKRKGKSNARILADKHGLSVEKIYKRMYKKSCSADEAVRHVLAYERQKHGKVQVQPKGLPEMLTRSWA